MLPISLRAVFALNAATFQVSSLALLSIVNTRVGVPAEYLPAYGAVSFLPYSLRPIFAWVSSLLLSSKIFDATGADENKNRHDRLLLPAFLLACLAFVGTTFIPSGGFILCFLFGFARGIAGAWSDFLIGMAVIEFSRLQARFLPSLSQQEHGYVTYQRIVSVNTAQSSTAKNIGSFLASIATFFFFSRNRDLGERVANTLLVGTAAIFLLTSLVSLKYQFHVGKLIANFASYDSIDDDDEELMDVAAVASSSGRGESERVGLDDSEGCVPSSTDMPANGDGLEREGAHIQQILEVSTLISFQMLLAVSALHKPMIAISNQTTWVSLMVIVATILVFTICLGFHYEQKTVAASPTPEIEERIIHSQRKTLPHRQLNLYFLLRYSMPIAGFLMYSYLYTVFESEPEFLQLLSVLKTAIGSLSTLFYEKFLSPRCHSGWPLIGLIAGLDIVVGTVTLLDVWVVRAVREKQLDGEYTIDAPLRCLVAAVGLTKYFFAELDYMPALVLSTTNVCSDHDTLTKGQNDEESHSSKSYCDTIERVGEVTLQSIGSDVPSITPPNIDMSNKEEDDLAETPSHGKKIARRPPAISAGMQYASFLSCIDFGAQIGDWISVPIIASLGITRENHWDHLDRFVVMCAIFRMVRVVFLWLICPPVHFKRTKP